ncbi:hypothetical protein GCM10027567_09150 [Spongiibacter taiwanensis]
MSSNTLAKILIVDDEPASITSLKVTLEHASSLIFAESGAEAIDVLAKEEDIDLILLDVELPDLSGFKVCERIKASDKLKHIPVIFLTGYEGLIFESQAFEAGAVDYITKPASVFRVLMRVNAHLIPEHKISLKGLS